MLRCSSYALPPVLCATGGIVLSISELSCPWVGLTRGLSWVGSTIAKVLKILTDYVNAFKARLDKIWLHQAVKFVSCIGLVWFGSGWIQIWVGSIS